MDRRPCLYKLKLFYRKTPRKQLAVDADGSRIFSIINVEMRLMMLIVI